MRHRLCFESLESRQLLAVAPLILQQVGPSFSSPVVATHAGDGSGRLFVAEQGGLIHILSNGQRSEQPFLDIRSRLITGGASGERGLLGLAFHPEYASAGAAGEGLFYVYYSAPALSGGNHDSVIAEYRVSASDPNRADIDSARTILRFSQPQSNHNGGDLKFGPDDGLLYISSGDGGGGGDPGGHGQNAGTLLGAILRIDIGGDDFPEDELRNYSIPLSNPFVGDADSRAELFAIGLRNPFRMSFDDGRQGSSDPDRLFVGDVGQNTFEEVNIVEAGGNYGWNQCEGDHVFRRADLPCPAQFEAPVAEYGRGVGVSVIGGFVYRGSQHPGLEGVYLFGDLNGTIMALEEQSDGSFARSVATTVGIDPTSIIAFGEDESGELYALTFSRVLSIGTESREETIRLSGEVTIDVDGDELVVEEAGVEQFRASIDELSRLNVQLSTADDQVTVSDLSLLDSLVRIDGDSGNDSVILAGGGKLLDLTGLQDDQLAEIEVLDIRGDGANQLRLRVDNVLRLSSSSDLIEIVHDDDDMIDYGSGWTAEQPSRLPDGLVHRLAQDIAIVQITNTLPFQNPLIAHDANRDGDVSALDALQIVNALANRRGPLVVPDVLRDPFVYLDVSGDGTLSALDALRVINEVARRTANESELVLAPLSDDER